MEITVATICPQVRIPHAQPAYIYLSINPFVHPTLLIHANHYSASSGHLSQPRPSLVMKIILAVLILMTSESEIPPVSRSFRIAATTRCFDSFHFIWLHSVRPHYIASREHYLIDWLTDWLDQYSWTKSHSEVLRPNCLRGKICYLNFGLLG